MNGWFVNQPYVEYIKKVVTKFSKVNKLENTNEDIH